MGRKNCVGRREFSKPLMGPPALLFWYGVCERLIPQYGVLEVIPGVWVFFFFSQRIHHIKSRILVG